MRGKPSMTVRGSTARRPGSAQKRKRDDSDLDASELLGAPNTAAIAPARLLHGAMFIPLVRTLPTRQQLKHIPSACICSVCIHSCFRLDLYCCL